jgi:hypothetical protein
MARECRRALHCVVPNRHRRNVGSGRLGHLRHAERERESGEARAAEVLFLPQVREDARLLHKGRGLGGGERGFEAPVAVRL